MKVEGLIKLDGSALVMDIVDSDHRTAEIFRRYDIAFCCGGKWPLKTVCEMRGLDYNIIQNELEEAMHCHRLPAGVEFRKWETAFLVDYIINIHHRFLQKTLPVMQEQMDAFAFSHEKKYPFIADLVKAFQRFSTEMLQHLQHEEETIFPYIKRVTHAYKAKESYAGLLVRTLRKPVENLMNHEHEIIHRHLTLLRRLTNNYLPAGKVCTSHKLIFSTLEEIDNNTVQHVYLENEVLFPAAIMMEKELLNA